MHDGNELSGSTGHCISAGPHSLHSLIAQPVFCRAAEFSHTVIHKGGGLSKAPLAGGVPGGIAAGAKSPMLVSIFSCCAVQTTIAGAAVCLPAHP